MREAIAQLRGPGVHDAILAHLAQAKPEVRAELIRALGQRRDAAAAPVLREHRPGPRRAASRGRSRSTRFDGRRHLGGRPGEARGSGPQRRRPRRRGTRPGGCLRPRTAKRGVLSGGAEGHPRRRGTGALRPVAGCRSDRRRRCAAELRAASQAPDPAIRNAAIRTLADACGLEAAPDLLRLARKAPSPEHGILALRGYWRMVSLAEAHSTAQRLRMCEAGMAASQRPEERKLGLTEVAKVPDPGALRMVMPLLEDPAVRGEAALAAIRIARDISPSHHGQSMAALNRVLALLADADLRQQADAELKKIEELGKYITVWQISGPYARVGKNYAALFDIPFPAEQPDAQGVAWRQAAIATDSPQPWVIDLIAVLGVRDQCVAYARTSVYSDQQQPARLEMGSDDGLKVWWNGKVVHANNTGAGSSPIPTRPTWSCGRAGTRCC